MRVLLDEDLPIRLRHRFDEGVVIEAVSNDIETLLPFMLGVNEAVQSVREGAVIRVKAPS